MARVGDMKSILFLALFLSITAHAELYKWVDASGMVNYSDSPPPASVKKVASKNYAAENHGLVLPFELAKAASDNPVTLYVSENCVPCSDGRTFLKENGIPFSEKTIVTNEDIDKLKQVGGNTQLPLFIVGSIQLHGFEANQWRTNLTQAGYPEKNLLPKEYLYPAPQPAAPVTANKEPERKNKIKPSVPTTTNRDPNGFQF